MQSFEYSYSPKADLKKSVILISMCLITFALFGASSVDGELVFAPIMGAVSSVFLFLTIAFSVRLLGTRYAYRVVIDSRGDGDLVIYELHGYFGKYSNTKRTRTVCRVSLYDIREVISLEKSKEGKKKIRATKKRIRKEKAALYNYCTDIFSEKYSIIKIVDDDDIFYIRFSPDEKMLGLISR